MKVKIGFFISKPFEDIIDKITIEMQDFCEIIYFRNEQTEHIVDTYNEYLDKVDAFAFSGLLYYLELTNEISTPQKPCFYLDETNTDITQIFMNLLLENRNIDFSRIFIDMAGEENNYLNINEILKDEPKPIFNTLSYNDPKKYYKKVCELHIKLHQEGKIDLSITRFASAIDYLEENNLPYIYAFPPFEYIINFLMKITHEINRVQLEDQKPGTIVIDTKSMGHEDKTLLEKTITDYARLEGYSFTSYDHESYFEILTNYKDIERLTDHFKVCKLSHHLKEILGISFSIGIGTGFNIYNSKENAYTALNLVKRVKRETFFVTDNNQVIELSQSNNLIIEKRPSSTLLELAKTYHIAHFNLQKVISYSKINKTTILTSASLASYLGISLRSASRIMTKIAEGGGAETFEENTDGGKGRPKKYFNLTFLDKLTEE